MLKKGLKILAIFLVVLLCVFLIGMTFVSYDKEGWFDPRMGLIIKAQKLLPKEQGLSTDDPVLVRRKEITATLTLVARKRAEPSINYDIDIPVKDASIRTRIYQSNLGTKQPVLLYLHGGGFILGTIEDNDNISRGLSEITKAVIVIPEYRLAPENKYPKGLDDCFDILLWIKENAEKLNADPERIYIIGDSAGGNLAMATELRARSQNLDIIKGLILIYPVLDLSNMNTASYKTYGTDYMLSSTDMAWFKSLYLNTEDEKLLEEVSPLLAKSLDNLPKILLISSQFDVLHDEAESFSERLKTSNTKFQYIEMKGLTHGFISIDAFLPQADDVYAKVKTFIEAN